MATTKGSNRESSRRVSVSPVVSGVKRERSDDEDEEQPRRVSRRTDAECAKVEQSMVELVTQDFRNKNVNVLGEALVKLRDLVFDKDKQKMSENQRIFFRTGAHLAVVNV